MYISVINAVGSNNGGSVQSAPTTRPAQADFFVAQRAPAFRPLAYHSVPARSSAKLFLHLRPLCLHKTHSPRRRMTVTCRSPYPINVYASWTTAIGVVRTSHDLAVGAALYKFCSGYLQALQDAETVDERICRFQLVKLQGIWIDLRGPF